MSKRVAVNADSKSIDIHDTRPSFTNLFFRSNAHVQRTALFHEDVLVDLPLEIAHGYFLTQPSVVGPESHILQTDFPEKQTLLNALTVTKDVIPQDLWTDVPLAMAVVGEPEPTRKPSVS